MKSFFPKLGLPLKHEPDLESWERFLYKFKNYNRKVTIALVGKYVELHDAYKSIVESFIHAGAANDCKVNIKWVHSAHDINVENVCDIFKDVDGILVAPGFGQRGIEGKLLAIEYARTNNIPFLGICLGMQMAVIEYARNVLHLGGSRFTEMAPENQIPGYRLDGVSERSYRQRGTMRLGAYKCVLKEGSKAIEAYGTKDIEERHRHRYEFNGKYTEQFEQAGMITTGVNPDTGLTEIVEIPTHKWFVGTQFHPEYKEYGNQPASSIRGICESLSIITVKR